MNISIEGPLMPSVSDALKCGEVETRKETHAATLHVLNKPVAIVKRLTSLQYSPSDKIS